MSEHGTVGVFGEKLLSLVRPRNETAPNATLLLRIMAGSDFFCEVIINVV